MTLFLPGNIKSGFLKTILAMLFHLMKQNEDWGCQAAKKKNHIHKHIHIINMINTLYFNSSEAENNKCMKKRPKFASWSNSFMKMISKVDNKTNS